MRNKLPDGRVFGEEMVAAVTTAQFHVEHQNFCYEAESH